VYKAKQKETGSVVAIKILPVVEDDEEAKSTLRREIKLMKECDSEHIVKFHGSYLKGSDLWVSLHKIAYQSSSKENI
jgi:serine/threonine protein kinase